MINSKKINAYKTIGEVAKELDLVDKKNGQLQTHTIRYWETQFKQIKPHIGAGKRRYYSPETISLINTVKNLLKEKGLTINGVKKILNSEKFASIDEDTNLGIYKRDIETTLTIKNKIKNISKIIRELKKIKNG
jgi:DNA-binding transcriptional MerR regulator